MELLVAISLGSMLLMLAAFVLRAGLDGRQRLETRGSELTALKRAYETISRDMHSAVRPPDDSGLQFGLTATPASGATSVLQLASVVGEPLLAPRAATETALIQYGIAPGPRDGAPTLWRYETAYPVAEGTSAGADPSTRAIPLLSGVVGATYAFYSSTQQTWVPSWDGETGLPTAIRMDLALQAAGDRGEPTQESWMFTLPAAPFANDEAAQEAESGTD